MSSLQREHFRQQKPRIHAFLVNCVVRRTLRSIPAILSGDPVVIGIVAGDISLVEEIQNALTLLCAKELSELEMRFAEPPCIFIECQSAETVRRYQAERAETEFLDSFKKEKSIFAVVEKEEDLPSTFRKIADAIVVLERPTTNHLIAAFRFCKGLQLTEGEAEELTQYSLFELIIVASRGKGWRRALRAIRADAHSPEKRQRDRKDVTLQDLGGLGDATTWGLDLAKDLADWKSGSLPWADVDRGILIVGPPGTGKTTFARALANTCGVDLVATSIAQWQSSGHLGDLLKAMRNSFAEAKRKAPCILFLDEFDSAGDRVTASGENSQYIIEKVNGLLECLDGLDEREGVVIVGACNNPGLVDLACLRPGRLERTIEIPLPNLAARSKILRWHLGEHLVGEDLSEISELLEGYSGADIEKVIRDARRRARRDGRGLSIKDLVAQLPSRVSLTRAQLRRVAVHEAGHALVFAALGDGEIVSVSIKPSLSPEPGTTITGSLIAKTPRIGSKTRKDHESELAVHLAGLAAEELVLGAFADGGGGDPSSDLAVATRLAAEMEASYGLGDNLVHLIEQRSSAIPQLLRCDVNLRRKVEETLVAAFETAKEVLANNRAAHEKVLNALIERHKLDGEEIMQLIDGSIASFQAAG